MLEPKVTNDNSKLFLNNTKNTFNKRNKKNNEKINNYNERNVNEINNNIITKKIGLVNIPIKQSKYTLLNNTLDQSRTNGKRKNKFLFGDSKEFAFSKLFNNSNNNKIKNLSNDNNNKHISSSELRYKQSYSQINTKENKSKNNKALNSRNFSTIYNTKKDNRFISIKDNNNKFNEDPYPSLNNNDKISNTIKIKEPQINTKVINKSILLNPNNSNSKDKDKEKDKELNSLSGKEKAYYLLAQSKVLRLCERIIFSRTSQKIRSLISINDILKSNQIFIKDKIKELEQKIIKYNNIIEMPFSPTKIAIISLNLILKDDEDEFKNSIKNEDDSFDENDKEYYMIYVQLLIILFNEEFHYKNKENININNIYEKLEEKGFLSFKDYLYELFIVKKFKKESINEKKIDKYIELFEELPDLIKYEGDLKNDRFISFSYFILFEVNNYLKKIKEIIQLKNKMLHYIDGLRKKIININN